MQNNTTDKKYHGLSEDAYNIKDGIIKEGEMTSDKKFKVLAVENNVTNSMQAMAVAPVDSSGKADTSRVVIAYAGTSDFMDILIDFQQVVRGLNIPGAQIDTSEKFADKIKKEYPNSTIDFTGHSLGGYLAVHNAARNKLKATVFNAPDASNSLTK